MQNYGFNVKDEAENFENDEKLSYFHKILNSKGIFDSEGDWVRCPNCGTGLHYYNGVKTCPECGPV